MVRLSLNAEQRQKRALTLEYTQPELPDLTRPITVSHSEAETAARCPFQHQLAYRERWSRPASPDSAAGKGVAWHAVLETHYKAVKAAQDANEAAGRPWWDLDEAEVLAEARAAVTPVLATYSQASAELGELLSWMYAGHAQYWGADLEWRIIDVERTGEVALAPPAASELPSLFNPAEDASGDFRFKYKADLVIAIANRLYLVDHKSVFNFPSQMDLDFDSQFDRYNWALVQEGVPIFGQFHNQARRRITKKAQPLHERFRRPPGTHRTPAELDGYAADLFLTVYWRYAQLTEQEDRAADAVALASEQYGTDVSGMMRPVDAPRVRSSRHCSHLCDMAEACLHGSKGGDTRAFLAEEGFAQDFTRH